jgi:hypothetical protein
MSKPFIQIGDEVREMTDAEFAQHLQDVETEAQEQRAAKAKADARSKALAKLSALGLTEAEIVAIIKG